MADAAQKDEGTAESGRMATATRLLPNLQPSTATKTGLRGDEKSGHSRPTDRVSLLCLCRFARNPRGVRQQFALADGLVVGLLLLPSGPGWSPWLKGREEPAVTSRQASRRPDWEGILPVFAAKDASYEIPRTGKVETRRSEAVTKTRQPHQAS